jgi:hypothetical protein
MATKKPRGGGKKAGKTLTQEMAGLLAKTLIPDLTARARQPAIERALRQRWEAEKAGSRTAAGFDEWVGHMVEQVGAAWILSCLFVRVLEDRGFLDRRRIAGEGASDSLQHFIEIAPSLTERDYLLTVFRELASYPGAADVLGPAHNPAWRLSPSNDSVRALLALLHETDAEGGLRFRFEDGDTRFLGDLYQDLSEGVRKRFALLQTPGFVERFILDQTLEPAIREFGLDHVQLIDPTCGSGHFLLGAFGRLFEHHQRTSPGLDRREHAAKALGQVFGADINPYAVAIARFRLTLAYLGAAGIDRLAKAPRIVTNLVVADSLLHGGKDEQTRLSSLATPEARPIWGHQMFDLEDTDEAERVLSRRYQAVVGNPPYIQCKDKARGDTYRTRYESCYREFALSAPFTERFFGLAAQGGFVGLINANSFMKREFGKALIEKVLPHVDLSEVVDTSGAYIPGHGTPTVILFGRNRPAVSDKICAVMGKRGEPTTPEVAEQGKVWTGIAAHHRDVGFENEYVSVAEIPRSKLAKHPWSLGGGGAAELKARIEESCGQRLTTVAKEIGFGCMTRADDIYFCPRHALRNAGVSDQFIVENVEGEVVRDWAINEPNTTLFPYDGDLRPVAATESPAVHHFLWPHRALLWLRREPNGNHKELGMTWWEWSRFQRERFRTPLSIAFAFVATHNHFVLDRGGKVFNRSAPIIKLGADITEDDHLALLAYLNSSAACFWMKQVFYPKSTHSEARPEKGIPEDNRYEFAGTGLLTMPVPTLPIALASLAREMEKLVAERRAFDPIEVVRRIAQTESDALATIKDAEAQSDLLERRMVALQEDMDWAVYGLLRLADGAVTGRWSSGLALAKSDRPFAREDAPSGLGEADRVLWLARKEAIASSPELTLIETAVFKRRWWGARGVFASKEKTFTERAVDAARTVLAEWSEDALARHSTPISVRALHRELPVAVERLLRVLGGDDALGAIIDAVSRDGVPFLPAFAYSASGLEKHAAWEKTWAAQRAEDRGEKVDVPLPPKYEPDDYQQFSYWSLRGKLDVPKERFISYPGCEREEDKSPVIGWAGWNHLQRAQALAALFQQRKDQDGWDKERLTPILAGLLELLPWLKQWHNDPDPSFDGQRMGDSYESFVTEKARELGLTLDELRAWRPPRTPAGRKVRAPKAKAEATEPETP